MKCLSILQPWASLLVLGILRHEVRVWKTRFRGEMAIHASSRYLFLLMQLGDSKPLLPILREAGYAMANDLPRQAVIGTLTLVDCMPAKLADLSPLEHELLPYSQMSCPGQGRESWVWKFENPRRFTRPLPTTGKLGLFDVEPVWVRNRY